MRITTWNVKGLNAPNKKRLIKQHLNKLNVDIILLQETKLSLSDGLKFNRSLGIWGSIFLEALGMSGGLGIIWNPKKVDLQCLEHSSNWMCVKVQSLKLDLKFIFYNFL